MPNHLFMEERRRLILDELSKHGRVSVSELSEQLNVSAVTIRQDLNALEAEGQLSRTHGGAVQIKSKDESEQSELSFDIRRTKQMDEKDTLGREAAQLIEDGSAIALDASTTICRIIPHLQHLDGLTIVTNNLMIPELLLNNPRIPVLLPGGRLRRDSYSVVGNPASLPDINLNIGFFSAWGIAPQAGLTEVSEEEMAMKQALLKRCVKKIVLVDSRKWGQIAPYTYAHPHEVDLVLTTALVNHNLLRPFKNAEIRTVPIQASEITS